MIPEDMVRAEFGLNYKGEPAGNVDPIIGHIAAIDPRTDELERVNALEVVIELIAHCDEPRQAAYLNKIQDHFKLSKDGIEPFARAVKRLSKDQREPAPNKNQRNKYIALGESIVDLADQDGRVVFLVLEGKTLRIRENIVIAGEEHLPPPKGSIPWLLPPADRVIAQYELDMSQPAPEVNRELFEDIRIALEQVSELPSKKYYVLTAAWVFHTYLLEKFDYSPIISLFATHERGKSRTGKALVYLAYRGIHVESLREPFLFRMSENFGAAIFIDVIDLWGKAQKVGAEDIVMSRFERGIKVPRVLYPEKGKFEDTEFFRVFSPTIIGTNEPIDAKLDSRAIEINMPFSNRTFENEVRPESFVDLKVRLTSFRARYLNFEVTDGSKPACGRLGDITKPILQTIKLVAPGYEAEFRELLTELESARTAEKSQTLEAVIIRAVIDLKEMAFGGKLSVKEITKWINQGRSDRSQFKPQTIGRKLSALGFKKPRMSDGSIGITYDKQIIAKLFASYGLEKPSDPSEPSVKVPSDTPVSEETEGTEGYLHLR